MLLATVVVPATLVTSAEAADNAGMLSLPVRKVAEPPAQYTEFCNANPGHCEMIGAPVLAGDVKIMMLLARVNRDVNADIRLVSDWEAHGVEELWSHPIKGVGDCEDFALEKRRRLVAFGLPRAALTIAIVSHKTLMHFHAVLLADTTAGTYVLDNVTDEVLAWTATPYNFYARERADGKWDYFDQTFWSSDPPKVGCVSEGTH